MSKISLRVYNREIERLIEEGKIDESVTHCRHILKTFPKHLETHRLLGKAYLEGKRYEEASNIFKFVLSSVPDDFVSHVGMSLVYDEQNKLDSAIWHMERSFETQSSNAAIQGELKRLYGRRDGMEPPKIRMTRGALAHIYINGELYPQAIAEIRGVLQDEPQRIDMNVLLAIALFRNGQRANASEICNQLLKQYQYCLAANRIMIEILPYAQHAESTQIYRLRVNELDPYAAYVRGSIFQSNEVSDAAVSLERLEYLSKKVVTKQNDDIPELLRVAGWMKSNTSENNVDSDLPDQSKDTMPKPQSKISNQDRSLQVFLCHSSSDKPAVRQLYLQLSKETWVDPWLDEEKLDPGDRWNLEIRRAVKNSDIVIVCISINSINKEGFVQKEIKFALDVADEKPEGTIFIIPLKLEECTVPDRLSDWQWVNYYQHGAYERLMRSLRKRARALGITTE